VFDEANKILTDINYCEVFGCIRDLLTIKAPFVFLCGCLPLKLEPEFYKVTELQSVDVIHIPTSRPEIVLNPRYRFCGYGCRYAQKYLGVTHDVHWCQCQLVTVRPNSYHPVSINYITIKGIMTYIDQGFQRGMEITVQHPSFITCPHLWHVLNGLDESMDSLYILQLLA
jgi:hypothetical protein